MKKLLIIICVAITLVSCIHINTIHPSGRVTTETRYIDGSFSKISVSSGIDLVAHNAVYQQVLVEAHENLHDHIEIYVNGNTLVIKPENHINFGVKAHTKVYVTAEVISQIEASGGSEVNIPNGIWAQYLRLSGSGGAEFDGLIGADEISINLSGGGESELNIVCDKLNINGSGGSQFELEGETRLMDLTLSGGAKLEDYDLVVTDLNVRLSGGSQAEITVIDCISGALSGGSRLKYKGSPVTSIDISGGSSVSSR